jgi:hypothetical protein
VASEPRDDLSSYQRLKWRMQMLIPAMCVFFEGIWVGLPSWLAFTAGILAGFWPLLVALVRNWQTASRVRHRPIIAHRQIFLTDALPLTAPA